MRTCPTCSRQFIDAQLVCPLDDARLGASDDLGELAALGSSAVKLGRVLGNYRLVGVLGEGGMGTVYVAAHTRLDRYVAVKVLRHEIAARRDSAARFFAEARTVNRIDHPNIVESIDVVEDANHGMYAVLELLRGPDLKTVMRRGRLPLAKAVGVAAQIADALSAVHAIDIVHKDLKPDNMILIARDGRDDFVKLIDFGVSQAASELAGATSGTAAYMAPEQAAGDRVDGRADLYALGVLLFEMATGRHPFPSRTDDEYLMRHAGDAAPLASEVDARIPPALDAVIARCLAKTPGERFASAGEVAGALRAIAQALPPEAAIATGTATFAGERYAAGDPARRARPVRWLVFAGAGAVIAASIAILALSRGHGTTAAAASVLAPAPPAQVVVPATVSIEFDSSPTGAQVFRTGETAPLGITPFATTFARSDRGARVRFELANHAPTEVDVELTSSHASVVALVELPPAAIPAPPPAAATRPRPPRPHVQREGTMDPFAR